MATRYQTLSMALSRPAAPLAIGIAGTSTTTSISPRALQRAAACCNPNTHVRNASTKRPRTASAGSAPSPALTPSDPVLPTLLVGPPDPISNLRPVRYASPLDGRDSSASASASARGGSGRAPSGGGAGPSLTTRISSHHHPYSLSEFSSTFPRPGGVPSASTSSPASSTTTSTTATTATTAAAASIPPSAYYAALLAQLEAASLAQRLRVARAHAADQRFWADNNVRFGRDEARALAASESEFESGAHGAGAGVDAGKEAGGETREAVRAARFYSAWLSANARRHRAYNAQHVRRVFGGLGPEARWRVLVGWVRVVGWWEREVRARVLRLVGGGAGRRR